MKMIEAWVWLGRRAGSTVRRGLVICSSRCLLLARGIIVTVLVELVER
jgi:hypothetical protein